MPDMGAYSLYGLQNGIDPKMLKRAKEYGLTKEVKDELDHGATPWEALYEWDLLEIDEFEII